MIFQITTLSKVIYFLCALLILSDSLFRKFKPNSHTIQFFFVGNVCEPVRTWNKGKERTKKNNREYDCNGINR